MSQTLCANVTIDNIGELTPHVMEMLDDWKLNTEQIMVLLGLVGKIRSRQLQKYRHDRNAFPFDSSIAQRIDHLVGISDALRTTFPFSEQMRILWLRKPHRRFRKISPLKVMLDEGISGLMRVRIEVDCAYGWAISEALAQQQKNTSA